MAYSINTSSAKSTSKSPYEVVFDQKPSCDIEMWQVLSNQGVIDADLPTNFVNALKECEDLTKAVEPSTLSNIHQPSKFLQSSRPKIFRVTFDNNLYPNTSCIICNKTRTES